MSQQCSDTEQFIRFSNYRKVWISHDASSRVYLIHTVRYFELTTVEMEKMTDHKTCMREHHVNLTQNSQSQIGYSFC